MTEWLDWLHPDFRYEVPIPVTKDDPTLEQYSTTGFLAVEVRASIELWVRRTSGDVFATAYAENPPVRTRHFVTNVQASRRDDGGLQVVSNVLLTWSRRADPPLFMAAARHDVLLEDTSAPDGFLLRSRRVLLDSEVVHLNHLRVIF